MDYTETTWVNGSAPAISDTNLNKIEAGVKGANTRVSINSRTAAYTLVLLDAGRVVEANTASALTVTIPPNSAVAFPVGTILEVLRYGVGTVTVAAGTGVTLRGTATIGAQYGSVSLLKRGTDEWIVSGGS